MAEFKDYYKVLQVDPSAEPEIITAAYRRLALKYHPDTSKSPDATRKMQEINEAYGELSDPGTRTRYDQERERRRQDERAKAEERAQADRHRQAEAEAARRREQEKQAKTSQSEEERQQKERAEAEERAQADRRRQAEAEATRWREQERQRRDGVEIERNWAAYEQWSPTQQIQEANPLSGCVFMAITIVLFVILILWLIRNL